MAEHRFRPPERWDIIVSEHIGRPLEGYVKRLDVALELLERSRRAL